MALEASEVSAELDHLEQAAQTCVTADQPTAPTASAQEAKKPVQDLLQAYMHLSQLIASGRHPQLESLRPRAIAFNASVHSNYKALSSSLQDLQVCIEYPLVRELRPLQS